MQWQMIRGFFVFFSSRRRHTRCSRDWSSDVCSSDLFVEKSGPTFLTLRGQGGEEVVFGVWTDSENGVTRVRASTLFFDQAIDRFLSTLPLASQVEVA